MGWASLLPPRKEARAVAMGREEERGRRERVKTQREKKREGRKGERVRETKKMSEFYRKSL